VDLNSAGIVELVALPGIGTALAERIIAYRQERGSFSSVEELIEVPGIGSASLNEFRDLVKV
jgi:competence protein ComEA